MKNKIATVLIVFLVVFLGCFGLQAKSNYSTRSVGVELDLEEMPNVKKYEIEIKKKTDKKNKSLNYSQTEALFKLKLEVGNYEVRTRIISDQNETGPWSDWSELLARPDEVESVDFVTSNVSIPKNHSSGDVAVKWPKADGAEKYIVWVENQEDKTVEKLNAVTNEIKVNVRLGENKIGIQSVSKDGIKSKVKYAENSVFVARSKLPSIEVIQNNLMTFSWLKQINASVKIDIYRKAFFGDKYVRINTLKETGERWVLPQSLQPGEYRIDFQYVSDVFENGPVRTLSFLKKPDENSFILKK